MKYLCLFLIVSFFAGFVFSQREEQAENRQRCRSGMTYPSQRCNQYWRCFNGYWRLVYCPYRQVYDQYRRRCEYPWNVRGRCGRLQGENEHEHSTGGAGIVAIEHGASLPLVEHEKKSQAAHTQ